jgi:membrane associated rhomboid family serine protease
VLILFFMMGVVEIPSIWFIAAFFLKDLLFPMLDPSTAHAAHVVGTLFGAGVCLILLSLLGLPCLHAIRRREGLEKSQPVPITPLTQASPME